MPSLKLTDEVAMDYMNFAARMGNVSFKDDAEMLSFKTDFSAALSFIQKLDEVDVSTFILVILAFFVAW